MSGVDIAHQTPIDFCCPWVKIDRHLLAKDYGCEEERRWQELPNVQSQEKSAPFKQ